jgi:hypothetical protein
MFLISFFFCLNAFAHGENKPGPHEGYIRMPGSFHTELVAQKDGSYLVYLLDLQNKNPTLKDSSVDLQLRVDGRTFGFKCMAMSDHFHCENSDLKEVHGKSEQIIVRATRLGIEGRDVLYKLPLSLQNSMDHSKH